MIISRLRKFRRAFSEILSISLNAEQANYIAGFVDPKFNIYWETGFGEKIAIPRHVVAETVLRYFNNEELLIEFFIQMMRVEGLRKGGVTLEIKGKFEFINFLRRLNWIYDSQLGIFYLDKFTKSQLNFLKSIKLVDLRNLKESGEIINNIKENSDTLTQEESDWQISMRLYMLNWQIEKLLIETLKILLSRLGLESHTSNLTICLKELATNASKANFKLLYEKYFTAPKNITAKDNYIQFLELFKDELDENGLSNLHSYINQDNLFFDIEFKSTPQSIFIWVHNYIPLSDIEKKRILSKLNIKFYAEESVGLDDKLAEGAGLGLKIIQNALEKISPRKNLLKAVFYPENTKIGIEINKKDLIK